MADSCLAKENRVRSVCCVHRVLLHPAGPNKTPPVETSRHLGAVQAGPTLYAQNPTHAHINLTYDYS